MSTHVLHFLKRSNMLNPTNGNRLALVLSDDSNQEPAGDWVQTLNCLDTQGWLASSDLTYMQAYRTL